MTLRFDKAPSATAALWFGVVFSAAFAGLNWLVLWLIGRVRPAAQPASSATSTATD